MDNIEREIDNIINISSNELDNNDNNDNNVNIHLDSQNVEVFNVALHQYLKIDEEIKALVLAIKTRTKAKKDLADTLTSYLKTNNISNVNLSGSYSGKKLETKVSYSTKGFSKHKITEILCEELQNEEELFERVMASIGRTNIITEKTQLKILSNTSNNHKTKKDKTLQNIQNAEDLLND